MTDAEPYDPEVNLDLPLAKSVLERYAPVLRFAADADTWIVRGPDRWENAGKDYALSAVAEISGLMPKGDPHAEKGSPERVRAERRARFMTKRGADAVAGMMRAEARRIGSPYRLQLSELDAEPWLLWAGGAAYDLRDSKHVPARAAVDPTTPHLHTASPHGSRCPGDRSYAAVGSVP